MKTFRQEKIRQVLAEKPNCCQTVALTFCEEYGVSAEQMKALTAGYGGGMSLGEKCGAVTAMFLIAGLHHTAHAEGTAEEKKAAMKELIVRLNDRFYAEFGSTGCNELKANIESGKYDLSDVESRGLGSCVLFMEKACDILEEELGI